MKKALIFGIAVVALALGSISASAGDKQHNAYPYKPIPTTPCFDGAKFVDGLCITINDNPTLSSVETCSPGEQKRINGHIYTCGYVDPKNVPTTGPDQR